MQSHKFSWVCGSLLIVTVLLNVSITTQSSDFVHCINNTTYSICNENDTDASITWYVKPKNIKAEFMTYFLGVTTKIKQNYRLFSITQSMG